VTGPKKGGDADFVTDGRGNPIKTGVLTAGTPAGPDKRGWGGEDTVLRLYGVVTERGKLCGGFLGPVQVRIHGGRTQQFAGRNA